MTAALASCCRHCRYRLRKIYVSVCEGTFLDKTHLSIDGILVMVHLFVAKITSYQQILQGNNLEEG